MKHNAIIITAIAAVMLAGCGQVDDFQRNTDTDTMTTYQKDLGSYDKLGSASEVHSYAGKPDTSSYVQTTTTAFLPETSKSTTQKPQDSSSAAKTEPENSSTSDTVTVKTHTNIVQYEVIQEEVVETPVDTSTESIAQSSVSTPEQGNHGVPQTPAQPQPSELSSKSVDESVSDSSEQSSDSSLADSSSQESTESHQDPITIDLHSAVKITYNGVDITLGTPHADIIKALGEEIALNTRKEDLSTGKVTITYYYNFFVLTVDTSDMCVCGIDIVDGNSEEIAPPVTACGVKIGTHADELEAALGKGTFDENTNIVSYYSDGIHVNIELADGLVSKISIS